MKRPTYLLAAAIFCASPVALAKGSSHPKAGEQRAGMVSADVAPRARVWYDERLWQTTEGQILVCEEQFKIGYSVDRKCFVKGDKDEQGRWSPLPTKHADGFVLKGYEYRFVGSSGYKILIAYYGPPDAPVVEKPADPVVLQIKGPVQVQADKVIVQRRKR